MKRFVLLFCLISYSFYAQTAAISGVVIDKNTQDKVPYATVALKSIDTIVTGTITNEKGEFSIRKINTGNYMLEIQFIGFTTYQQTVTITSANQKLKLPSIFIEEDTQYLGEVEIEVERSTITQKIDRKVINVGKDLTTTGASASDIMMNIPSVSVNQDGEISLRGNDNVRILVDGKPTNMSSTEVLQQIPSTAIKTIELITNPSAKYNPEGMSGIINIILKKNSNLGFNGSIDSGVTFGEKTRFNSALSLNYRAGKLNVYGSYGNQLGKQVTSGSVTRFIEGVDQSTNNINDRNSHLIKIGIDYFMDEMNTFSLYTNQNFFKNSIDGARTISFFNNSMLDFAQLEDIFRDNTNATYNLDFKHNFPKKGHIIELEFDFTRLQSDTENIFTYTGNSPINNYDEIIDDTRTNTTINLDYTNPINEKSILEMGMEIRLRRSDNTYITNNLALSNSDFSYDRDINSFYTTFSQSFSKWQYNLGVRLENYSVEADFNQIGNLGEDFTQNLLNVFPSGFVKYSPNEDGKNAYQLSFSRRIDRPSLNQINPIRQISTPQIIITGNPSLRPQFTNSVEVNYTRKINKGNMSFGAFYRRINDEINRIGYFDVDNPSLFIVDYENFDSNDAYGFEFNSSYRPTNWWNFNVSFDVYSRTQQGVIEGENVNVNNTLLNAKVNNSFKATKKLTFQLFTFYSGPQEILQYELKENFFMNAGARYNFAQGKGTISVNFNDIFRTQRFAFETYRTIFQRGEFRRDTQTVYFGLSYRFGGKKNKALVRKKRDKNEKADKFL